MKKNLLFLVICCSVAFIVGIIPHCSKAFMQGYEQGFEREFIAGCTKEDLPESLCQCVYTELRNKHSMADLTKWSFADEFPDEVLEEAALACNL